MVDGDDNAAPPDPDASGEADEGAPSPRSVPDAAGFASESDAAFRAAEPRSFFAQPVPLKWMVGAAMALRTGPPPQTGQVRGPSAWTPWITSNRCPQ